ERRMFMKLLNIILCLILLVFIGFEGMELFKSYKQSREAMSIIKKNKPNVIEVRDYQILVLVYSFVFLLMVITAVFNIINKVYFTGIVMLEFSVLCIIFILECIITRTILFYDSGFLYYGKQYKYRSVLKIEDKKKWLRGYHVKMTNDEEVYVTKKSRPVMEEKLKEFKNRKKK
ncbi:MAG: hypothetical protein ACI4U3_01130, partial [Traorella sp.]